MTIAERVRNYRSEHGMTQEEMARSLGITQPMYNYYENGKKKPSAINSIKLAKLLKITVEELFNET